jgi:hypothetical protein
VTKALHHGKGAFSHETKHIAKLVKEEKEKLEQLPKQEAAALRLAALKSEVEAKRQLNRSPSKSVTPTVLQNDGP